MHPCAYLHWHHCNGNHHHRHHDNCRPYHITTWNCWSWQSSWVGWHSAPKRHQLNTWVWERSWQWLSWSSSWPALQFLMAIITIPNPKLLLMATTVISMVIIVAISMVIGHGDILGVVFYWCSPEVPSTATYCCVALSLQASMPFIWTHFLSHTRMLEIRFDVQTFSEQFLMRNLQKYFAC